MKRNPSLFSLLLTAATLAAAPLAHATLIHLAVTLSGLSEVPPNPSTGTGSVSLVLDTTAQTLGGTIVFSGLSGTSSAAHIHCCLAAPFGGGNVGVATLVPAFPGFPLGVTSGTDTFLLDLTQSSSYNPGFITAEGGLVANAEAALIAGLESDRTYLNIHSSAFPGGEIRGFVVPEPVTISLFAIGLAVAGFASRRRVS